MIRCALPLVALLALAACSSTEPEDGFSLDPLSQNLLRATSEVPAFGGVAFEGERLVVFTLGAQSAAEPAVRSIFGSEADVEIRTRPERGRGSESLKDAVSAAVFGAVEGAQSVDYDETTGYVRVGVLNAAAVRRASIVLEQTDLPTSEIAVQVEGQIVAL